MDTSQGRRLWSMGGGWLRELAQFEQAKELSNPGGQREYLPLLVLAKLSNQGFFFFSLSHCTVQYMYVYVVTGYSGY